MLFTEKSEILIPRYGVAKSLFGDVFLILDNDSICVLGFTNSASELEIILSEFFDTQRDLKKINVQNICNDLFNEKPLNNILVKGTSFQHTVWKELLKIPKGQTRTYSDIANSLNISKSVRAVANAIAKNPLSLIIPCHRVVPSSGGVGKYRWGSDIKKKLLEFGL